MQNENNIIDMSRYPLMDIGEIAADLAAGRSLSVTDFAKLTYSEYVLVHVDVEAPEDGIFRVKPGLYVSIPMEGGANGFCVDPDVNENELAVAISASIAHGMMRLGADLDFFIEVGEYEDVLNAMHLAVDSRTAAVNPTESAAILSDAVSWILDHPELTVA